MDKKDFEEVIITDKKPVKYFFQSVLYDSILTGTGNVVLSTIYKHQHIVERFLLPLFKMHGWIIDENIHQEEEFKPKEQIKDYGGGDKVTFLKYHLVRDPYNKEIIRAELKDKKNRDAFVYLLDKLDVDRKELNEEEAREYFLDSVKRIFNYLLSQKMKQLKYMEKQVASILKQKK